MLYATISELRAYTGQDSTALPDATATRAIEQAELDLDGLAVIGHPVNTTTGRRFDPTALSADRALALNRATCAQAQYRLAMGEEFFIMGQYAQVDGPDFTTRGTLPKVGPMVRRELAGSGLFRLTTSTRGAVITSYSGRVSEDEFPERDARPEFETG